MYFCYFLIISPCALHFNKLESYSPKDDLCQIWLKLVQWFLRIIFLIFVNVFLLFRNYLSLEKGGALHLNKLVSPSDKDHCAQVHIRGNGSVHTGDAEFEARKRRNVDLINFDMVIKIKVVKFECTTEHSNIFSYCNSFHTS